MALYRIHKNEWEVGMRVAMERFYEKTGQGRGLVSGLGAMGKKRKAGELEGEEEGDAKLSNKDRKKLKRQEMASAGSAKKGISSGLSVVVNRPGGKEVAKARGPAQVTTESSGNWWEA